MNNYQKLLIGIALIICGGVIGYNLKKCDPIIATITKTDTIYQSYPIYDTFKISYPKNVFIEKKIINTKIIHDTLHSIEFKDNLASFTASDTLSHEGTKVAILDSGNCNGIYYRSSTFFGTQNEKIITKTIEKTVLKQPQLFSLYAGANMSFINTKIDTNYRFKAIDFGPALGLNFKNKAQATYQYGIKTNQHNFSVQIKIK